MSCVSESRSGGSEMARERIGSLWTPVPWGRETAPDKREWTRLSFWWSKKVSETESLSAPSRSSSSNPGNPLLDSNIPYFSGELLGKE
jgi:hypothetical protein